ncbi:c-type cytochrome [Wenxinia marina]|nr:cytochrome c family protein [Wenxinia marina]GGL69560.1 cytochrome c [Wenxinia marina]
MIDTMTGTKIVGGFCGTFLVFLLGGWVAETIYHPAEDHGEGEHAQAYVIPVEESAPAEAEPAEEVNVEELFAAASASDGENLWRNCRTCHSIEPGDNGTGPTLYGVVGRPIDAVDGFNYTGALEQVGEEWSRENLFHFLENPRGVAPGTAMSYAGMRDPQDRADLIAWLDSLDD